MKKILLVDDHSIIRTGLKILLQSDLSGYKFMEAETGNSALQLVQENDFDLLILDINIPGTDTLKLAENMLCINKELKILVFSMNEEQVYAKKFYKCGAKGYIRKDEPADEIKKAVNTVLNNKKYISKTYSECLADDMFDKSMDNPFESLSPRQKEITRFLMQGKSISDICTTMNLHSSTVSTQKIRVFEKLKVKSLVDLYEMGKMYPLASA